MKIVLEKNQKIFFTSDTHYNHTNICRGISNWEGKRGTRDFDSLDEMNDSIIKGINDTVGPDDILVHLGDWSFGGFDSVSEFRDKIDCKNIILFLGNHDHHIRRNKGNIQSIFRNVADYGVLDLRIPTGNETKKYQFVCSHYPIASWDGMGNGVIHLHGHVHLPPHLRLHEGRSMDVGMDGNFLNPHSMEDIMEMMQGRPIKHLVLPKDHHTEN